MCKELKGLFVAHTKYIQKNTKFITEMEKHYSDQLYKYAKDTANKSEDAHRKLTLALGYGTYFATWAQLREIFDNPLMKWSYGFMCFSLFITIFIYLSIFCKQSVFNKRSEQTRNDHSEPQASEDNKNDYRIWNGIAIFFVFLSIVFFFFSAIYFICDCSCK